MFVRRRFLFFMPGPKQLPEHSASRPIRSCSTKPLLGPINREWLIYLGGMLGVVVVWLPGAARAGREHGADDRVGRDRSRYFICYMVGTAPASRRSA